LFGTTRIVSGVIQRFATDETGGLIAASKMNSTYDCNSQGENFGSILCAGDLINAISISEVRLQ